MARGFDDLTLYYNDSNNEKQRRFTEIQNVIADLYVYYWEGYKPQKTSSVSIDVSSEDRLGSYFGSILGPSVKIDIEEFWKSSLHDQYKILLESIHRITMKCALFYKWDTSVFEKLITRLLKVIINTLWNIKGNRVLIGKIKLR